ncbi:hypothetical protein GCM10009853_057340 [Glycomyces scopariae]
MGPRFAMVPEGYDIGPAVSLTRERPLLCAAARRRAPHRLVEAPGMGPRSASVPEGYDIGLAASFARGQAVALVG